MSTHTRYRLLPTSAWVLWAWEGVEAAQRIGGQDTEQEALGPLFPFFVKCREQHCSRVVSSPTLVGRCLTAVKG